MLELEAMGLDRVKTEASVQYVDHNLVQGARCPVAGYPMRAGLFLHRR